MHLWGREARLESHLRDIRGIKRSAFLLDFVFMSELFYRDLLFAAEITRVRLRVWTF